MAGVVLASAMTLALTTAGDTIAPPQNGPAKRPVYGDGISHLATRWDPHARVDVIHYDRFPIGEMYRNLIDPAYAAPRPDAHFMLLDQSAATQILDGSGDMSVLRASIIAGPYEVLTRPRVLIIGPGGGIDIQNALVHGASQVDAVEVNRGVSALMRGPLADYSGHIYTADRVNVVEDEARSFIRRSSDRYDLIQMTVVDSYAALASGAYALSESYLYTAEAFDDYLSHIADHGALAVGRFYRDPPVEMLNTAALGVDALSRRRIADPLAHLAVLRYLDFGLLIVRDDAFDVTLHYPNLRAVLRASMLAASPGPSLAVHGTRGSFIKYGVDAQEAALKAGRTPGEPDWDADPPPLYGKLTTPEGTQPVPTIPSSYAHYYENVRDAILGQAQLAVTPEQALNVMRGLELAVASSQRRCVLPWGGA